MNAPRGRFAWFDYVTSDAPKAQKFFHELLGWTTCTVTTMHGEKYTMIVAGGCAIGGYLAPMPPPPGVPAIKNSRPHWLAYLEVPNASETAVKVKQLGGRMMREPFPLGEMGKRAFAIDPEGTLFALWQPNQEQQDAWSQQHPGRFCWCELYTKSPMTTVTFFKQLAGFTEAKRQVIDGIYHMFEQGGQPRGGARTPMNGVPLGWFAWVRVTDIEQTLALAQYLGATIRVPVNDNGGQKMALITDPSGVPLGLVG